MEVVANEIAQKLFATPPGGFIAKQVFYYYQIKGRHKMRVIDQNDGNLR